MEGIERNLLTKNRDRWEQAAFILSGGQEREKQVETWDTLDSVRIVA